MKLNINFSNDKDLLEYFSKLSPREIEQKTKILWRNHIHIDSAGKKDASIMVDDLQRIKRGMM